MKTKIAIALSLLGAGVLGASLVAYSAAQPGKPAAPARGPAAATTDAFSAKQEEAIRTLVRAYLIEHPEVLIEAANALEAKQFEIARASAEAAIPALLDPKGGYVAGRADAKVAVIELFDYHCGYCKAAADTMQTILKSDPQVKVSFRELPILKQESRFAAEAALAARAQGKYQALHFALMKASGVLTRDRVLEIAKKEGLDIAKLEADARSPAVAAALEETQSIAQEMRADGTPAFLVTSTNGAYFELIQGFNEPALRKAIADAKKAAG